MTNTIISPYTLYENIKYLDASNLNDSNMVKIYSCENLFDLDSGLFLFDEEIEHKYKLHKSNIDCICHNIISNI